MNGIGYTIAAYAISLGLLLAYAARLWWIIRRLGRRDLAPSERDPPP